MIEDKKLQVWAAHECGMRPKNIDSDRVREIHAEVEKDLKWAVTSLRDSFFLFNVNANPLRAVTQMNATDESKLQTILKAAKMIEFFKRQK